MIEIAIPGKAFEIAEKERDLGLELRGKLKMGEKRKKGRGYRVFVQLTDSDVEALAKFFGSLQLNNLSLIEAQAVKNISERLSSIDGVAPVERPKPKKSGKGSHMRSRTEDAIWGIIYPLVQQRNCKCQLRKGMTLEELKALGAGCTDPHDLKYNILKLQRPTGRNTRIVNFEHPGYVCPTLDTYRRAVEKITVRKDDNELA